MDEDYWLQRIEQVDVDDAVAPPPPQPVPARGADEPTILAFAGKALRVTFFGVADGDDYLRMDWRGLHKRGPKLKASFTFSDEFSLNGMHVSDVRSLADSVLQKRLELTIADLVGSQVKMTETLVVEAAAPFKYIDLSARASVSYEEGTRCTQQLTLYVPARALHDARRACAAQQYSHFLECAAAANGAEVGVTKMAALVGHSSHTISTALGPRSPMGGRALTDIEATMRTHRADGFASFTVALEAALIKKGKGKRVAAAATGETTKRTRTKLGQFGQVFIDSYLDLYMTQGVNRASVVARILSSATLREDELGSAAWTTAVVEGRLHNKANERRAAEKRRAAAADAAEVQDVE